MKIGFSSLYFVDEWFLYFVNKVFFVYFVDKMVLASHKPGDIIFNNDFLQCKWAKCSKFHLNIHNAN
jgi:hypothetical protein